MKPRATLIYFAGCPNIAAAREQLLRAFSAAGLTPHWEEWDSQDAATPGELRGFGSPTILVDGHDVAPATVADSSNCRVYADAQGQLAAVPPLEALIAALRGPAACNTHPDTIPRAQPESPPVPPRAGRWAAMLAIVPAVLSPLVPGVTCPACWPAYGALLGSMGLGFVDYTPYLLPLTVVFIALALASLAWRARQRHGYGPFYTGALAASVMAGGRFAWESTPLIYAGIALLAAAAIWNAWPRKRAHCALCVDSN